MTPDGRLLNPAILQMLVDRLRMVNAVSKFDLPGEAQADTIVHSLADLEKSFHVILDVLVPKLLDLTKGPEELYDVLLDIGEELRHILYHIKDPRFFQYLCETSEGNQNAN